MRLHGTPTLLGLDKRYGLDLLFFHAVELIRLTTDASDFEHSDIWDPDPESGLGGWGTADNDYQITTGAFATDYSLVYPSPHTLRRQYTPIIPGQNGTNVTLATLFTPESQKALITGYKADYIHFQQHLEFGSHGAIHRIVGA